MMKIYRHFKWYYRNTHLEINRNLKHWGKNIEYVNSKSDTIVPYFRFYCFFFYFGKPTYID